MEQAQEQIADRLQEAKLLLRKIEAAVEAPSRKATDPEFKGQYHCLQYNLGNAIAFIHSVEVCMAKIIIMERERKSGQVPPDA